MRGYWRSILGLCRGSPLIPSSNISLVKVMIGLSRFGRMPKLRRTRWLSIVLRRSRRWTILRIIRIRKRAKRRKVSKMLQGLRCSTMTALQRSSEGQISHLTASSSCCRQANGNAPQTAHPNTAPSSTVENSSKNPVSSSKPKANRQSAPVSAQNSSQNPTPTAACSASRTTWSSPFPP